LALVVGAAFWKTGNTQQAMDIWQQAASRFGPDCAAAQALLAAKAIQDKASSLQATPPDPQWVDYLKRKPN
jgi:hypothetical protein